jgi:hypothetical protein
MYKRYNNNLYCWQKITYCNEFSCWQKYIFCNADNCCCETLVMSAIFIILVKNFATTLMTTIYKRLFWFLVRAWASTVIQVHPLLCPIDYMMEISGRWKPRTCSMGIQKISLYPLMFLPRLQKFLFYLLELFIIFFLSNGIYKKELDFRIFLNFRLCYIYVFHLDLIFLCQYFFFLS